jgi:hypothetical protein
LETFSGVSGIGGVELEEESPITFGGMKNGLRGEE